jgi:response regulator RpfG family c-di-GMP phosphodiesterase
MYNVTDIIKVHEELEDTQKDIIYRMGEIGESRSKETGNHVKRVAEYSKLLALLADIDEDEANFLYAASPMHDIGKVAIPDTILKKPGRLTDDEFEIMKTHSEVGYQVLKGSNRPLLKTAAIVAYTHHEKWNGTGYPRGLKGEEIHIYGRITAIADVFDALGSDRIYKKGWKLEKILKLFKEERGEHFDPVLVDIFLENLDKFLKIRDAFQD